ncbi:aromatic-ring-hydroxylating dioxygenase subunit beta [Parasphingopyxis algicola]|uniref:aromatic-ring-hydroxylating dioxygenase subunit beta n=1 Tax=Parasphingopyxis algicola TaxID=2026624 RepID=UPI0015A49D34|nr:aromatic-ring-hydroxylating dioxygenase subunit beta [Parasphingopyxis algicola]QLC23917.1 aromatic-ring-hydroxylating dioxygenase subunit beta [Parasphingopyxis algicola]
MIDAQTQIAVQALYARYASLLDSGAYDEWLGVFAQECSYLVQPRENFEAGLPLATMRFESRDMIADRIYGVTETLYHAPYYQRHILGIPLLDPSDESLAVTMNVLVIRTHNDQPSDILLVGEYRDTLIEEDGALRIAEKQCIFDSELIPNSLIYPV